MWWWIAIVGAFIVVCIWILMCRKAPLNMSTFGLTEELVVADNVRKFTIRSDDSDPDETLERPVVGYSDVPPPPPESESESESEPEPEPSKHVQFEEPSNPFEESKV